MRRKMIGGLVLAAILCMLSVFAAADGIQVMDTEGNETTLESYIDGHHSIILYGRTICGNCNSFLKGIKTSLKTLSDHGIRVIAVEENNAQVQTAAALKEYADNYPGITVLRDNGNANNSFWRWLFSFDSFDSSGSITLPMLFIRDAGGNLLDYSTGYVEDTSQFAAHAIELLTGAKPGPEPESGGLIGNITAAYVTEPYTRLPLNKLITWDVIVEGVSIDDLTVTYELLFCKDDTDDRIYTVIKSGDVKNGSFTLSISEEGRYLVRLNLTDRKGDSVRIEQNYYLSEGVNGDALSRKIKEIVDACIASGATDSKKIAGFLHDYLIDHAEYDINAQHKYDPEGVLLYGRGVCQSYANAYQMLLREMKIQCLLINGTANGERHLWNLVQLNGKWYHVDCTFDDPVDGTEHRGYFLIPDDMIAADHQWDRTIYPACTGDEYAEFDISFSNQDEFNQQMCTLADAGKFENVTVYYTGDNPGFGYADFQKITHDWFLLFSNQYKQMNGSITSRQLGPGRFAVWYYLNPANEGEEQDKVAAFVTRCYKLILGREPDEGGLQGWCKALKEKTAAASQIINGFISSAEFTNRKLTAAESVDILYNTMMDRPADEGGKAGWVDALGKGYTLQHIINGFCGSDEFAAICKGYEIEPGTVDAGPVNPQTDESTPRGKIEAFVKRCYKLILSREADEGGLKGWSDALEQRAAAAAQIIDGFVRSEEFVNRNLSAWESVDILYKTMLDREADPAGKTGWVDALGQGFTLQHIINGFCGSPEFTAICDNYGIVAGSVAVSGAVVKREAITPEGEEEAAAVVVVRSEYTDEEKIRAFVEHCYKAVFGREGDAEGIGNYTALILNGKKTPKSVAREFVFSAEFQGKLPGNEEFIRILYRLYFDREADADGLAGWVEQLEAGTGLENIVDGFAGSDEFKAIVHKMKE